MAKSTPSTKNLRSMPSPEDLWKRCVSLALADLTIGSEFPHYRLDPSWDKGALFRLDNGAGDEYVIAFVKSGVFIRGFDHLSPMSPWRSADEKTVWPGMFAAVPRTMKDLVDDPRVTPDPRNVTFCITYSHAFAKWAIGVEKFPTDYDEAPGDGSSWMLALLTTDPRDYVNWAQGYYGRPIAFEPVASLFAHGVLQDAALLKLNPKADLAAIRQHATAARYGKGGLPPFG